jgi:hypothetical protein
MTTFYIIGGIVAGIILIVLIVEFLTAVTYTHDKEY